MSGAADDDVADEVRARTSTVSAVGSGASEASSALRTWPDVGRDVEPGGGALADADLDVAGRGLEHDRAADDLAEPDVAVGGLGGDAGAARASTAMSPLAALHPQVAARPRRPAWRRWSS